MSPEKYLAGGLQLGCTTNLTCVQYKEMLPNNLRRLIAKFIDFIRFTLNRLRKLFSGSSKVIRYYGKMAGISTVTTVPSPGRLTQDKP